jgi:hypothetical protein
VLQDPQARTVIKLLGFGAGKMLLGGTWSSVKSSRAPQYTQKFPLSIAIDWDMAFPAIKFLIYD